MSTAPIVRTATADDAEAFAACQLACWHEAYDELWGSERFAGLDPAKLAERRRKEIASGQAHHVLAERDGDVVGIAISGPSRDAEPETDLELYAIYVRAGHQGTGIADLLMDAALGGKPASLWVYRDNPRASAFYVNHDFLPNGAERHDSAGILEIRMVRKNPVAQIA